MAIDSEKLFEGFIEAQSQGGIEAGGAFMQGVQIAIESTLPEEEPENEAGLEQLHSAELDVLRDALTQYKSWLQGRIDNRPEAQAIKQQMKRCDDLLTDVKVAVKIIIEEWEAKSRAEGYERERHAEGEI